MTVSEIQKEHHMSCKGQKGRHIQKKKVEETIEKINQLEQVKAAIVGFPLFSPYQYPEIQPGDIKSFLTMNYFFIFITKLQGEDRLSQPPSLINKVSFIGYS